MEPPFSLRLCPRLRRGSDARTYTLLLARHRSTVSPTFAIAAPQSLYETPLANALSFYENERDGPKFIPSSLRTAPAHLNDEKAMTYLTPSVNGEGEFKGELRSLGETIDVSGGWWDAGDYLKFVQTTSYTVALQLLGLRDFPTEIGASSSHSNFTEESAFGVEWLLRMWNDSTKTLYYQVGIGEGNAATVGDHDIWRPNLAGRDAAAFALCFQDFHLTRPQLASRRLLSGEQIFDLADTDPHGHLLTAIPFDFYPESEWRDDLELGASELATALASGAPLPAGLPHEEPSYYLQRASAWAEEYLFHNRDGGEGLNLYDVSGIAHFELARAIAQGGSPAGLSVSRSQLIAGLGAKLEASVEQASADPFGFGFPWDSADTASHGDGLAVMASEYDELAGEPTYADYAERWLGNVLGANSWGSSFIIGDGSTFPHCPQHQVANLLGSLDGTPPILAGAVVEGPGEEASAGKIDGMHKCPRNGANKFSPFDSKAIYEDNAQSYTNTEPAIDLTASSLLAFAWQIEPSAALK